jgi:broad specificity phosphatase PhoE
MEHCATDTCCGFYVVPAMFVAPMTATVFLARHASHDEVGVVLSGRSEIAINHAGHDEAARLARRLADVPLAAIHASPRKRARETAAIVAAPHGLAVEEAAGLDEIDFGGWAGRSFAALADDPDWQRWNEQRGRSAAPGGEDMNTATMRAVRHIESVVGEAPVLCVSHCDIIRGVVAHYLGLDPDRLLGFDVDPASLTELALYPGGGRVVALNERPR